jgi:hypothetical protein
VMAPRASFRPDAKECQVKTEHAQHVHRLKRSSIRLRHQRGRAAMVAR